METSCQKVSLSQPWAPFSIFWIMLIISSAVQKKKKIEKKNNKYWNIWTFGSWTPVKRQAHPLCSESNPVPEQIQIITNQ